MRRLRTHGWHPDERMIGLVNSLFVTLASNHIFRRGALMGLLASGAIGTVAQAQITRDVLTYHNDNYRSGVYAAETRLRPENVTPATFGKLFTRKVVGQIWGQPLYVRGVRIKGRLRNVVYVATSENWVYGFDADNSSTRKHRSALVARHLGIPVSIDTSENFHTILPSSGISSTPVIDLHDARDTAAGTLYVVARIRSAGDPTSGDYHVFGLDLQKLHTRKRADGSLMEEVVKGVAAEGPKPTFNASAQINRPALLIANGQLVVAFGNGPNNVSEDPTNGIFYGWVMAYALPELTPSGVFATTPNGGMGSVWQAGAGPAADDDGNVYFMTGNGHFHVNEGHQPDLADSFVKLSLNGGNLQLIDWYAPASREVLMVCDMDLGSSGPAVIPGAGKIIGSGKSGILYVFDKEHMSGAESSLVPENWRGKPDCTNAGVDCFRIAENVFPIFGDHVKQACDMQDDREASGLNDEKQWQQVVMSYPHVHGGPVLWNPDSKGTNLYVWPEQDYLKTYRFDGHAFAHDAVATSAPKEAAIMSMPGALLSLSWDGLHPNTGILWASRPDPDPWPVAGSPFISIFKDQQHFVFRDRHGSLRDVFYATDSDQHWNFQEIDTTGHFGVGDPVVSSLDSAQQQHFVYVDAASKIWDEYYRDSDRSWRSQRILTNGHTPAGTVAVTSFGEQQHFVFRDDVGSLWDSYYDPQASPHWQFQGIATHGHAAVGQVVATAFSVAGEVHVDFADITGLIWDCYSANGHDWNFQQIDFHSHVAVDGVSVSEFIDQQHYVIRDAQGLIWDEFFAPYRDPRWNLQQIGTQGHLASDKVFVSSFVFEADSIEQQHFVLRDSAGSIWDSFYDRPHDQWTVQPIDNHGHVPVGSIVVSSFVDQQHFVFVDSVGALWDSFYAHRGGEPHWRFQQLNGCFENTDPSDVTPNEAPCNAINKIVPGYLEAFEATPDSTGHLRELWSSGSNAADRVRWFSKESPPTIADGKVFLTEFPAKPPVDPWNASSAIGHLIVYSNRKQVKPGPIASGAPKTATSH
jgi:hypothetical protein